MIVGDPETSKALGHYRGRADVRSGARYPPKGDGCGFTVTQTTVSAGFSRTMRHRHHVETNFVIAETLRFISSGRTSFP